MPKVRVNDINIYYEVHGEGFPLVMIMGLGADVTWWEPELLKGLAENFKVIIFDNRGAGRSDKPAGEYSIELFADDTVGLMDDLGIKKAHILGVSMGGMIAQEIAINYPNVVEKLVLVVTSPGGPRSIPPSPKALEQLTMDRSKKRPEEVAKKIVETLFPHEYLDKHPEILDRLIKSITKYMIPPDAYMRQLSAIMNFNSYERLYKIRAPTLIVMGGKDIIVPQENGRILAERIPNSRLVIFEESGHGLIVQERDRFLRLVTDFLLNKV